MGYVTPSLHTHPFYSSLRFVASRDMRKLQVLPMLLLLALLTRPMLSNADFHVVNLYYGLNDDEGFDYQMVIPSSNWGCGGVPSTTIAGGRYPDCRGGYALHVPNNTCNCSGVTIKPACKGSYFGKLHDQRGGDIGDCFWHDAGDVSAFTCNLDVTNSDYQIVYDRLLCNTNMCG